MATTTTQSMLQLLNMLPDQKLDRFVRMLSPQAKEAIESLGEGANRLQGTVADEIAQAVWSCLES